MPEEQETDRQLFGHAASAVLSEGVFAYIGAAAVWLVHSIVPHFTKPAFWFVASLIGIGLLRPLLRAVGWLPGALRSSFWGWMTQVARLTEVAACLGAVWLAARLAGYAV